MRSSKKQECCVRSILLTIVISACISIIVFIFLQFSGRETNLKDEIPKENLFRSDKLTGGNCIPVCDSRNCITQANLLLRSIKPSIDPCENFQKFLCGSYEENFGRNENQTVVSDMEAIMRNKIKNIIENIEAEPESVSGKLKIMYDSCINTGSEVTGIEIFRQILNSVEIFQWPHLAPNFTFSDAGLPILLGTLRSYAEVKFLIFDIYSETESDTDVMEKYMTVTFTPFEIFMYSVVERNVVSDILKYFDIEPEDVETILNDHEAVKDFLISFWKENQDKCEEYCPDVHIDCSCPGDKDWEYLCETVQVYLNVTELKQHVSKNEIVINGINVFHAKNLIPRLKTLSGRSLANFFALDFLWHRLDEVGFFFRQKKLKHLESFKREWHTIAVPFSNKWEYCVAWIMENMKDILENELTKSYLTRAYVDEIHDIYENYTSVVADMITHQDWIDFVSKASMKDHINGLKCNMEYIQQNLPKDAYFNEVLKTFNPTTSFLHNTLGYHKSLMNSHTRLRIRPEIRNEPEFTADASTDKMGSIDFSYGIFMPPVYYKDHKKFVNHILFAPIVVHEIGHNLIFMLDEMMETSNETREIFFERYQCMENQFSKFKLRNLGENLNGTKYVVENLSDNLGYAAADMIIKELWSSKEVFLLPGLPYSPEELLFMSSRQVFCSKSSRRSEETYTKTDEKHAPAEFRIIGSVQNSKAYSEIFCCPEGSYMNPTEKCTFLDTV